MNPSRPTVLIVDPFSGYVWARKSHKKGTVKLLRPTKPISYAKAHAAKTGRSTRKQRGPVVITQNCEPTGVIQDIEHYEQVQDTFALLRILTLGNRQIEQRRTAPATDVITRLRERRSMGA